MRSASNWSTFWSFNVTSIVLITRVRSTSPSMAEVVPASRFCAPASVRMTTYLRGASRPSSQEVLADVVRQVERRSTRGALRDDQGSGRVVRQRLARCAQGLGAGALG